MLDKRYHVELQASKFSDDQVKELNDTSDLNLIFFFRDELIKLNESGKSRHIGLSVRRRMRKRGVLKGSGGNKLSDWCLGILKGGWDEA